METEKWVVKIYNKEGIEVGEKVSKKWTVLSISEFDGNANLQTPFAVGDKIEILREFVEVGDDRVNLSDKMNGGKN